MHAPVVPHSSFPAAEAAIVVLRECSESHIKLPATWLGPGVSTRAGSDGEVGRKMLGMK